MRTPTHLTIALLAALALAACDGGSANDPDPADRGVPGDGGPRPDTDAVPGPDPDPDTPRPAGACDPIEDFFAARIWGDFMSTTCVGCHIEGGAAGASRLHLTPSIEGDGLRDNLEALRPFAAEIVPGPAGGGLSLLVAKPTGRHPESHGGGALLRPDGEEAIALAWFARRIAEDRDPCLDDPDGPDIAEPVDCAAPPPGPRGLRRLSHVEYGHTVEALLGPGLPAGLPAQPTAALAPDEVVDGFDNHAAALVVTDLLADQYRALAEELAAAVDIGPLVPCGVADGGRACARAFIVDFGLRAFRRPLTAGDIDRYLALYDLVAVDDGFEAGVRWIIGAMLQSPHFLYRTELGRRDGDHFRLTAYEIATQLAYLIWQGPPDEALLDLAARGALYDDAVVAAEVERLLQDPRSERTLQHFAWRWLGLDRLASVTRDPGVYPALTPEIRSQMAGQTARFLAEHWRAGSTLGAVFTAQDEHLTDALADFYGLPPSDLPADPQGFRRRSLEFSPYGGLLTQGALLTTHALPTSSSPIHRGLMVRERLLCQHLPPPPVNLDVSPPPVDPSLSTRERYAQHSDDPACSGCHDLIDPIGFAFEHFDGIGRWRPDDGIHAIDDSGAILGSAATNGPFDGVDELAVLLAGSPDVEACYAEQWLRHGFGGTDRLATECYIEAVTHDMAERGGAMSAVIPAMARLPRLTRRTGGEAEGDVPGGELLPDPADIPPGGLDAPPPIDDPPPEPEPEPGPAPGGVDFELVEQSRWQSGYCADGVVRNIGDAELAWSVEVNVEGTIRDGWNANRTGDSGRVTFTGVEWNAVIPPGGEARFGFCADL